MSLSGPERIGIKANTISRIVRTEIFQPLGIEAKPKTMRATGLSYILAYNISMNYAMTVGSWSSESTMLKYYKVAPLLPVEPHLVEDARPHDWRLARAVYLADNPSLRFTHHKRSRPEDTVNDAAIAAALSNSKSAKRPRRLRRKRSS